MTGVIICDAGPLVALGSIGQLDLLRELFSSVLVPDVVAAEVQAGGGSLPGAAAVREASWLLVLSPVRSPDPLLSLMVDAGERSVIDLARETPGAAVLIDESRGREVARSVFGLSVIGTGRVLIEGKKRGLIAHVKPLLSAMRVNGYWMSEQIKVAILKQAGEE